MIKKHDLYFYFYPGVLGNLDIHAVAKDATIWLSKMFAQTTNRRFRLAKTEIVTSHPTGGSCIYFPSEGFNIHIYFTPSGVNSSLWKENGDGVVLVATSNKELSLLSAETGVGKEVLHRLSHEISHVFGVAIGEYYEIRTVIDLTQVAPKLKVGAVGAVRYGLKDGYWSRPEKKDWLNDPMLIYNPPKPKFCWLSSQIINSGKYRPNGPPLPDLTKVKLKITPRNSQVDIWSCRDWTKIASERSDQDGVVYFHWGANEYEAKNQEEQFKIIKIYPDDGQSFARGVSVWDLQEAYLRYGENYVIDLI